jgi:SPP1 family predicted phage head-tail adaptor
VPKNCRGNMVFDKIVRIQKPIYDNKNSLNKTDLDDPANWKDHCKAYANCKTSTGREYFAAEQPQADVSHVWKMSSSRLTREITPDMRLIFEGKIHEIVYAVDENEARQTVIVGTRTEPVYAQ